jgi:hypothetical protein
MRYLRQRVFLLRASTLRGKLANHREQLARTIRLGQIGGGAGILGFLVVAAERERGD